MHVIIVMVESNALLYADWYRAYADTDEGRYNAMQWAKQNGYDSMIGPSMEVGVLNQYCCDDVKIKIIRQELLG